MNTLLRENATQSPLSEAEARALWEEYRGRVAALAPRCCAAPLKLTDRTQHDRYEEEWCAQKHRKQPQFLKVVKLDNPAKLVVHQLVIAVPESEKYLVDVQDSNRRVSVCLGKGLQYKGFIPKAERRGQYLVKRLPHFEYTVGVATADDFEVQEGNRHITVKEFDGRMLLATGTHRAHVAMYRNRADENVPPVFAVLESDIVDRFFAPGTTAPLSFKRDMVRSACPPLLGDFFDPNVCLELPMRRRRMILRVDLQTRLWYRDWEDGE